MLQEGWLAKYAVSEEDKMATGKDENPPAVELLDPMQGLEKLDYAGPHPE